MIKSFDIDGVISIGIHPGPDDVIITGRSFEEYEETAEMLEARGIKNQVFYSPVPYFAKTREISGHHKAKIINGLDIRRHFDDDPIQVAIIRALCDNCVVIEVISGLVNLENERKYNWRNEDA